MWREGENEAKQSKNTFPKEKTDRTVNRQVWQAKWTGKQYELYKEYYSRPGNLAEEPRLAVLGIRAQVNKSFFPGSPLNRE
jgi:hypothetical protein